MRRHDKSNYENNTPNYNAVSDSALTSVCYIYSTCMDPNKP